MCGNNKTMTNILCEIIEQVPVTCLFLSIFSFWACEPVWSTFASEFTGRETRTFKIERLQAIKVASAVTEQLNEKLLGYSWEGL
jgi:hypothetical protein